VNCGIIVLDLLYNA